MFVIEQAVTLTNNQQGVWLEVERFTDKALAELELLNLQQRWCVECRLVEVK